MKSSFIIPNSNWLRNKFDGETTHAKERGKLKKQYPESPFYDILGCGITGRPAMNFGVGHIGIHLAHAKECRKMG